PRNPESHYLTTGPELWEQTAGRITHFICGVGTGGTISGSGKYLKEQNSKVRVIGIDPKGSVLREYFYTKKMTPLPKTYKVEGIGQDYVPGVLDFQYIDEIVEADDRESFLMARRLTREEGILSGGSGGTAVAGMMKIASTFREGDVVVVLLPDTGERYISKIYDDEWMRENGFLAPERITVGYVLDAKAGKGVIAVPSTATVRKALDMLRQHDISQIPVIDDGTPVGAVQDHELMRSVMERPEIVKASVREVMVPSFPVVEASASLEEVLHLMRRKEHYAVLVRSEGKIGGILNRYDVIEYMGR
ncbi:MAG TPA: pyridoxal-phosphate dependent enzyme, partial [Bacteroidota bacterium]|nr:pyridoxal-phosphate dependent enzyme [Bacteroidota bacterium]